MSIDPMVLGLGGGTLPPASLASSEPVTIVAGALGAIIVAALAMFWASAARTPFRRRRVVRLVAVRP
jgi:hypothetical protein